MIKDSIAWRNARARPARAISSASEPVFSASASANQLANSLIALGTSLMPRAAMPKIIDGLDIEIDPVVSELRKLGSASNRVLAGRLGWSEAKVSRHVALLEQSGKNGR